MIEVVPDTKKGYSSMKKKVMCLWMAVMCGVLLFGCKESKLQQTVESINQECPMSLGIAGDMTSVLWEDGNVVITCQMNEDLLNLTKLKESPAVLKESALSMCRNATGDLAELISLLSNENAGLILKYKGISSGTVVSAVISRKDLEEAASTKDSEKNPLEFLETQVNVTNSQLPMQIADGMTIIGLSIEGGYVVYDVDVDEDLYSIASIEMNKKEVKQELKRNLSQPDASLQSFIAACKNADKGIAYRYMGDISGNSCMIKIASYELEQ